MGKTTHANKFQQNYDIGDDNQEEEQQEDDQQSMVDQTEFEIIQAVENLQIAARSQLAA